MFTFDPKMPKSEDIRVVGTVVPPVPVYAVYVDIDTGKLFTRPVVCFVAREFVTRPGHVSTDVRLYPIALSKDLNQMIEESMPLNSNGFLGLSEELEPKKDAWNNEIRELKKRFKSQLD